VGCLGTDGITKDVREVLMKAKGLREEGISAWIYTGAYQVPPPSITGDYARDIALIEEVIGLGEIALSDHRSSTPGTHELIKLVEHTRVAGMLSGKAGIVNIHMGDAHDPFKPIYEAVNNSELPIKQFYPTHCNRNEEIFQDAKQYGRTGYIDLTASSYPYFSEYEIKPSKALNEFLKAGVPLENITISSDANGSLPGFDKNGNLVKLEKGMPDSIWTELKDAVLKENISMDKVLKIATENVANILKLKNKGRIMEGFDADCLIVDKEMNINTLISKGRIMIKNKKMIARGTYE
jgi:beta-aspartyl-dipeptidase (metallo-type)